MLFAKGQLFAMKRECITYFEALHTLGITFLLHPVTDLWHREYALAPGRELSQRANETKFALFQKIVRLCTGLSKWGLILPLLSHKGMSRDTCRTNP